MRREAARVIAYGHRRTSLLECQCISGYFLVNSTDMPSCKACPAGVECLGGFGEDPVPVARPAYYLLSSTSNELVVTRCKVDRGEVCRGGVRAIGNTTERCGGGWAHCPWQCKEGHAGPACGRCARSWARDSFPKPCVKCSDIPLSISGALAGLGFSSALCLIITSMHAHAARAWT